MRKLICLLVACLMVTAGCASLKNGLLSREVPRFAVVDWDRLVKQHPKYKVWQKQKTDLETAKALRERQLKDGHQQLAILGKMRSLAGKGRDRFRSAQLAAKVAEKEAQEQDLLQKKAESLDAAAESYVQKDREDVETRFRIPLFNVRLKLGSIKMSEASQNALLQEEQELLDKRREAIEAIEEKKAAWIKEQMASDISESRARMDAFQQSLTVDLVKEETGLDVRNAEGGYVFTYKRVNPDEGDNYFVDVYRFVMDIDEKDLHLQEAETDGYMFATLDEIKAFAAEGKFLHYDSIKKAFEM